MLRSYAETEPTLLDATECERAKILDPSKPHFASVRATSAAVMGDYLGSVAAGKVPWWELL